MRAVRPSSLQYERVVAPELTIIEAPRGISPRLRELARYRELAWFLLVRMIKPRYRQTVLGIGWAILPPLVLMGVFTVFFNRVAKVPSAPGIPYPLFALSGLLIWQFFTNAVTRGSSSLLSNSTMVTKVYFPRTLLPLSAVLSATFDLLVSFVVLVPWMAYYEFAPGWQLVLFPGFVLLAGATALAISLLLTAASVQYRDLGLAVPLAVQVWLFVTPVIYPVQLFGHTARSILAVVNPMASITAGFRWSVLGRGAWPGWQLGASAGVTLAVLFLALLFFDRMERTFADEI
jgi:lipopolysaccharide transport system permease protein